MLKSPKVVESVIDPLVKKTTVSSSTVTCSTVPCSMFSISKPVTVISSCIGVFLNSKSVTRLFITKLHPCPSRYLISGNIILSYWL